MDVNLRRQGFPQIRMAADREDINVQNEHIGWMSTYVSPGDHLVENNTAGPPVNGGARRLYCECSEGFGCHIRTGTTEAPLGFVVLVVSKAKIGQSEVAVPVHNDIGGLHV